MKTQPTAKTTLAAQAARLVARLVTQRSRKAELACYRWAARSTLHERELLKTLKLWSELDGLKSIDIRSKRHRRTNVPACANQIPGTARVQIGSARIRRRFSLKKLPALRLISSLRMGLEKDDSDD